MTESSQMGKVILFTGFRPPVPAWVADLNLLLWRPLPRFFTTELAAAMGVDERAPAIVHAAVLKQLFGVRVEDLSVLFKEIGTHFGDEGLCCRAVWRIAKLLDCSGLARASATAQADWEKDQEHGPTARATLEECRRIATARYTEAWKPLDEFMKHIVLLVEATRCERISCAGGTEP